MTALQSGSECLQAIQSILTLRTKLEIRHLGYMTQLTVLPVASNHLTAQKLLRSLVLGVKRAVKARRVEQAKPVYLAWQVEQVYLEVKPWMLVLCSVLD